MAPPPRPELHEKPTTILAICQKMNSERDLGALLDLIAREAASLLGCDRAGIFLLDRERNELWSKVAPGSDEILRFDARLGITGSAVLTVAVRNQKGEVIGVFEALNKRTGAFHARDEEALAALASHAAIAIETAQLIGELRRNQDELAQQNAHLWREVESNKAAPAKSLKTAVEELERRMIVDALEGTRNNQQQASRVLGLSRQGLINKIKRYSIRGAGQ
ncbi:MAG: helix-turn-helix domain-containing protein [Bryobacteraceae bacterium]